MRNISFALTTTQFLDGSKTVTRRLGWRALKAGDRLMAVRKSQGLKKGEKVEHLGALEVVSVRRERLAAIEADDVPREGFPDLDTAEFVGMFCEHNGCEPGDEVTRIEFRRLVCSCCLVAHPPRDSGECVAAVLRAAGAS